MKKYLLFLTLTFLITLSSCDNKLWDSGTIENIRHGGHFVGYTRVYTIDWSDNTKSRSSDTYRVYKRNNGKYIIDYEGENYELYKADKPFGTGAYALKWQFDYKHYIEDIPSSF